MTLLHVLGEDETEARAREHILQPMTDLMRGQGIDVGILQTLTVEADDAADTIVDMAENYDLLVIGETKPSIRDILFGTVPEGIARTAYVPILVVRHLEEDVEVAERVTRAKA